MRRWPGWSAFRGKCSTQRLRSLSENGSTFCREPSISDVWTRSDFWSMCEGDPLLLAFAAASRHQVFHLIRLIQGKLFSIWYFAFERLAFFQFFGSDTCLFLSMGSSSGLPWSVLSWFRVYPTKMESFSTTQSAQICSYDIALSVTRAFLKFHS